MYPYHYPPPGIGPEDVERIAKVAIRLKERDARKKMKMKETEEKKAKDASNRMMTSLEWFIIGIILQPVVGPMYNMLVHRVMTMATP
jgi:hypothetical protein